MLADPASPLLQLDTTKNDQYGSWYEQFEICSDVRSDAGSYLEEREYMHLPAGADTQR